MVWCGVDSGVTIDGVVEEADGRRVAEVKMMMIEMMMIEMTMTMTKTMQGMMKVMYVNSLTFLRMSERG